MRKIYWLALLAIYSAAMGFVAHKHPVDINVSCIHCLCHVNGCDLSKGCTYGYCGPFQISRSYWISADKPTLLDDDPKRDNAFEDCTNDYHCSVRTIKNYVRKYGKDCNGDGKLDCEDFVMMHFYQDDDCYTPLFLTSDGLRWLERFEKCHTLKPKPEEQTSQNETFYKTLGMLEEGLGGTTDPNIQKDQYEKAVRGLESKFKRFMKALKEEKKPFNIKMFNKFSSQLSQLTNETNTVSSGNKKKKHGHKKRSRTTKSYAQVKKSYVTRTSSTATTAKSKLKNKIKKEDLYILSLAK